MSNSTSLKDRKMEEKETYQPLRLIPHLEKLTTTARPRGYIGCSVIGHECDRYIWLNKYGDFTYEIPFRLGRIFDRGKLEEERIFSSLKKLSCFELISTQVSFSKDELKGNCDAVLVDRQGNVYILELKTMNDRNFKALKKYGLSKSNTLYWSQCQAYMKLSRSRYETVMEWINPTTIYGLGFSGVSISKAIFLAVNKNDESLHEEIIDYDPAVGEGLVAKAERIDQLKEMPEGIFSTDKKPQTCFNCSFHKYCYGEINAETNL